MRRPARIAARPGSSGEIRAAIRSTLMKSGQFASRGRYSNANVVLPAPFGPAMMKIRLSRGFDLLLSAPAYCFRFLPSAAFCLLYCAPFQGAKSLFPRSRGGVRFHRTYPWLPSSTAPRCLCFLPSAFRVMPSEPQVVTLHSAIRNPKSQFFRLLTAHSSLITHHSSLRSIKHRFRDLRNHAFARRFIRRRV